MNYEDFAQRHLTVVSRSGDEVMVRCLFHDDSHASMQFNVRKGVYICFACDAAGNARTLMRAMGAEWTTETDADLADVQARLNLLLGPDQRPPTVLSESVLNRYRFPTDHWRRRGISTRSVRAFDLGYDPINDVLTIPIRNLDGGLTGFIKRYMDPDLPSNSRYRYPRGFKKNANLFASWLVQQDPRSMVVLTEGALDAVKVWQAGYPALAIYGSSMSGDQVRLLDRLGVVTVYLFFDNDKAGYKAARGCLGHKANIYNGRPVDRYIPALDLRRKFVVRSVAYDSGMQADPGACSGVSIRKAVAKALDIM